jgi:hypothetical protein
MPSPHNSLKQLTAKTSKQNQSARADILVSFYVLCIFTLLGIIGMQHVEVLLSLARTNDILSLHVGFTAFNLCNHLLLDCFISYSQTYLISVSSEHCYSFRKYSPYVGHLQIKF